MSKRQRVKDKAEKKRGEREQTQTGGAQGSQGSQAGQKGGKGKGKGKKGFQGEGKCAAKTPQGDMICYAFNSRGKGCSLKDCRFKHVCGICFQPGHGIYNCPKGGSFQ